MLPKHHAAYGALAATALAPWLKAGAPAFWVGSVFFDVDHYLWYVRRRGDLDLRRAYRFFRAIREGAPSPAGDARPFHGPVNVGLLALLAWRWPAIRPLFLGILFHSLLDAYAEHRLNALLPLAWRATG